MKLQALSSYREYIEINDLPCFCRVKSALSHQSTLGRYIFIENNEKYHYGLNSIYLGAWDTDKNFYIFINGILHQTQQKYFDFLSAIPESTLIKWSISL